MAAGAAGASDREHGAHVHGVATLNVAVEGDTVEMALTAPGADIVGFEYTPKTAEEKAAVKDAATFLEDASGLFAFPPEAGCQMQEARVDSALLGPDHDHDHKHEDHDHDAHGEKADGHAEHSHDDHDHHAHGDEPHAEFQALYRFQCTDPDRLDFIDVKLFERFPTIEELDVQAISNSGQSARELTPSSARLTL
ncbi:MAG: DUF2796 domain-containing protein [Alphaproteobacteria bacterium]|nr:DUF2796 domain-containing protein [Alphaproteobacteria bacterium]